MDQAAFYGQQEFNLPHDVVPLPSKGIFYKPKKESLKVGYLTANDENMLMSSNIINDGIIFNLLKSKIYEPGFDINQMIDVDIQSVLLFIRNTSFGSEYSYTLTDPSTGRKFDASIVVEEIDVQKPIHSPDENGHFELFLPKSKKTIKLRLLTLGDTRELDKLVEQYPQNMVAPIITKRLEKHIVSIDGDSDRMNIVTFVSQMPISDSKDIRKFIKDCEPKLDLTRTIVAPSGERVTIDVTFGAEFFRPFFAV
jgi:hypothetical protein